MHSSSLCQKCAPIKLKHLGPTKFSPGSGDSDRNIVCNEETLLVKTFLVLHCFYFLEYVTENLDTNLPCRMLHRCELPGFLERLLGNIHTHVPEDLCNLWRRGWKLYQKTYFTQTRSSYNCKIDGFFCLSRLFLSNCTEATLQQRETYNDQSGKRTEWLWNRLVVEKVQSTFPWLKLKENR